VFDTTSISDVAEWGRHPQVHDLERLRRSLVMAPLLNATVSEVLDDVERLAIEPLRVERISKELGPSWHSARDALNELASVPLGVRR
jgi:hypothetical protein